jgi:hypothetical protein
LDKKRGELEEIERRTKQEAAQAGNSQLIIDQLTKQLQAVLSAPPQNWQVMELEKKLNEKEEMITKMTVQMQK